MIYSSNLLTDHPQRKFHKIILGVIMTGAVIAAIILAILVSVSVDTGLFVSHAFLIIFSVQD